MKLISLKKYLTIKNLKPYIYWVYAFFAIFIIYHLVFAHRIIPGVHIGKVKVGGMTYLQAKNALMEKEKYSSKELVLKYGDKEYIINAQEVSLNYDWDASVSRAFEVGRTGNVYIDNKDKLAGFFRGLQIDAHWDYEDDLLGGKFSLIKSEINISAINASVAFTSEGSLSITPSSEGIKVVDESLLVVFNSAFNDLDFSTRTLPVKKIKPKILEEDFKALLPKINSIASNQITIKDGDKSWVVSGDQLISFLSFIKSDEVTFDIDEPRFEAFADSLAREVNELPWGQVLQNDGDKVVQFKLVKEGKELDIKEFTKRFKNAFFNNKNFVELPFRTIADSPDKDKYGILELLGEGVSTYVGSGEGRIHNLVLAAERTNGVLVPPGSIYSMNGSVGDISAETGYDVAYIIKEGRTVLGSGGGVCQTSTTLFRAVLKAGLPIIKRYPHAYRVTYYEQNMPVGFDAAVFQPSWDFQFKNDTQNYVLVQSSADLEAKSLTFKIYGTSDGRQVEISDPVVTNQTPPPPALYQDDPTLAKGVTRQIDFPAWGASVKFTRTVKRNDILLFTDTYNSNYQAWRAIYLVGTKE